MLMRHYCFGAYNDTDKCTHVANQTLLEMFFHINETHFAELFQEMSQSKFPALNPNEDQVGFRD